VRAVVRMVEILREETGLSAVALSGGVFQNVYLSGKVEQELEDRGFEVLVHQEVPPNDACIALGQVHVGREYLKT